MDNKKPIPEWHIELHGIISKYLYENKILLGQSLAFLSLVFIGTLEMNGFSEEFLNQTLDRMRENFKMKRQMRKERENAVD